ncbi:MAG: hypothetical protein KAX80_15175, partial [Planctomycetes bacterium]|nr:hypothetical protein [Planctomycetota bacterium]
MRTRSLIAKAGTVGIIAVMLLVGFVGSTIGDGDNGIGDYDCDTSGTFPLIGGQNIDTGDVMIWHDTETLYIKYSTDGNWWLSETHLFVGDAEDLPTTGSGNPQIGKFPNNMDHDPMVTMYTYEFDLVDDLGWEKGDELFIMAHAVVNMVVDGQVVQSETAFGCEYDFEESKRWAWYIDYSSCKVLEMPDEDVTVNVATASDSYFDTTVTDGGNDVPDATYEGWCFDKVHFITPGTDYTGTLYSSYDPFLPAGLQDDDWDLVNYIINHKQEYFDAGYSAGDIQNAIWFFFEDLTWAQLDANEQAIAQDAIDNGE